MTEKMFDNLQQKYKNSDFQILKICIAFSNFDFNLTVRKKSTLGCENVWKYSYRNVFAN